MLRALRNQTQSIFFKCFLVLLICGFALWGVGDLTGGSKGKSVLSVENQTISIEEALNEINRARYMLPDRPSLEDAIKNGIVYLSEERQNLGMTGLMSVKDNINMAIMDKNSQYLILDKLKDLQNASELQEKLNIKVSYWSQLAQSLSGGNQQKTVIAKWLSTKPEVLILDEPTKGIDVRSKSAVHEFMGELVDSGMSIIMISSELPEILGMCDRVVVMYKGLIKNILEVSNTSSEEIVKLASGE